MSLLSSIRQESKHWRNTVHRPYP